MKDVKLYNVIFPIWLIVFMPPVILISLAGNFIIDSLVLLACFFVFKMSANQLELKAFYRKSIIKVWLLGFVSDIGGAVILFITGLLGDIVGLPYEVTSAISYDPYRNTTALAIVIFAMLVSGFLIFIFNYRFTFVKQIKDKKLRFKTAMTIAIITIPWTFLLPTRWFYKGF